MFHQLHIYSLHFGTFVVVGFVCWVAKTPKQILGSHSQVQRALQDLKENEERLERGALLGKWGPKESRVLLA